MARCLLLLQARPVDEDILRVCHFHALIVVGVALELQLDQHEVWVSDQDLAARSYCVCELLGHMVNRHHAEVVLEVNDQEADGHVGGLLEVVDYFRADHEARILAVLKLRDVDDCAATLDWYALRNGLDHVCEPIGLDLAFVRDGVVGPRHKANDRVGPLVAAKVRINLVRCLEVLSRFAVSLEVLKDSCSVEEEVRVGVLHVLLCQCIGLQSTLKLLGRLVVDEEVGQVRVAQDVPAL